MSDVPVDDLRAAPRRPPPRATYRLQLGPDLDFAGAAELVGYLAELGVSHLYLSPVLTARPGSTHGYDVADPTEVAPDLGGEQGLRTLAETAHQAGLGLIVDIVPNHLGTGFTTPLWRALLAEGSAGSAGRVFDVDLAAPLPGAAGKVIVPVLGDQYGAVLHAGELRVVEEEGESRLAYYDHRFPLSAESVEALDRSGDQALHGTPGNPRSWGRLHALLEMQHYRLVHWRAGEALINYRRFFSIDELAGVRVEDERVFDHTHGKILELVADGVVDGLRIDHPDGLRDPARYLSRLAERSGGTWTVVEKITARDEALPDWPVAGTTGYEFCNEVLGLFVDPESAGTLDGLEAAMGGDRRDYATQVETAKREVLAGELSTDLRRVARLLWALLVEHPEVRDVDERGCEAALADVVVAFDVYRTFVDPVEGSAGAADVARVEAAVATGARAGAARGAEPAGLYGFLGELLTGRAGGDTAHLDVLARVQQLTGALMAKGVEDTVFYRYRRLLAVNEVGGEPSLLGLGLDDFHVRNAERASRHPLGMTTTATHDTKRGEDARLRIAALSELAGEWAPTVRRWHRAFAGWVATTPIGPAPDPQTELLAYQTLVGVWPVGQHQGGSGRGTVEELRVRVRTYLEKACREAGQRTSWRDPDPDFEAGLAGFLDTLLDDDEARAELTAVATAAAEVASASGLAQVLLRVLSPGVPDTYQGTEDWDLSLVDPDNRRPVDWAERRSRLTELERSADPAALWSTRHDGRIKTWVLSRALRARGNHPASTGEDSTYTALHATGPQAAHVVAFSRGDADGPTLVAVAPRLPGRLGDAGQGTAVGPVWTNTQLTLPAGDWADLLTGSHHEGDTQLSDLLNTLPVALLCSGARSTGEGGGAGRAEGDQA